MLDSCDAAKFGGPTDKQQGRESYSCQRVEGWQSKAETAAAVSYTEIVASLVKKPNQTNQTVWLRCHNLADLLIAVW